MNKMDLFKIDATSPTSEDNGHQDDDDDDDDDDEDDYYDYDVDGDDDQFTLVVVAGDNSRSPKAGILPKAYHYGNHRQHINSNNLQPPQQHKLNMSTSSSPPSASRMRNINFSAVTVAGSSSAAATTGGVGGGHSSGNEYSPNSESQSEDNIEVDFELSESLSEEDSSCQSRYTGRNSSGGSIGGSSRAISFINPSSNSKSNHTIVPNNNINIPTKKNRSNIPFLSLNLSSVTDLAPPPTAAELSDRGDYLRQQHQQQDIDYSTSGGKGGGVSAVIHSGGDISDRLVSIYDNVGSGTRRTSSSSSNSSSSVYADVRRNSGQMSARSSSIYESGGSQLSARSSLAYESVVSGRGSATEDAIAARNTSQIGGKNNDQYHFHSDPNLEKETLRAVSEYAMSIAKYSMTSSAHCMLFDLCDKAGGGDDNDINSNICSSNSSKVASLFEADRDLINCRFFRQSVDTEGYTPAHVCARSGNLPVLQLLIESYKVSTYVRDITGKVPLHIAAKHGHLDVCLYLKSRMAMELGLGSEPPVGTSAPVDIGGYSPLGVAIANGNKITPDLKALLFRPGDRTVMQSLSYLYRTGRISCRLKPPPGQIIDASSSNNHNNNSINSINNNNNNINNSNNNNIYSSGGSGLAVKEDHAYSFAMAQGFAARSEDRILIHNSNSNSNGNPILISSGGSSGNSGRSAYVPSWSLYGVFDGHGRGNSLGTFAVDFIVENIPSILTGLMHDRFISDGVDDFTPEIIKEVLTLTCSRVDELLRQVPRMKIAIETNERGSSSSCSNGSNGSNSSSSRRCLGAYDCSGAAGALLLVTERFVATAGVGNTRAVLARSKDSAAVHSTSGVGSSSSSTNSCSSTNNSSSSSLSQVNIEDISSNTDTSSDGGNKLSVNTLSENEPSPSSSFANLVTSPFAIQKRYSSSSGILDAILLTTEHNFNIGAERRRAIAAGADILVVGDRDNLYEDGDSDGYYKDVSDSVSLSAEISDEVSLVGQRLEPGLATTTTRVSRAFGDFIFKSNPLLPASEQVVVSTPDVSVRFRSDKDNFVILASQGLWEVMSNQEAVELVSNKMGYTFFGGPVGGVSLSHSAAVCDSLVERALVSDKNVSVVLVFLSHSASTDSSSTGLRPNSARRNYEPEPATPSTMTRLLYPGGGPGSLNPASNVSGGLLSPIVNNSCNNNYNSSNSSSPIRVIHATYSNDNSPIRRLEFGKDV